MKLLSPREVKRTKQLEEQKNIQRGIKVATRIDEEIKKLNKTRTFVAQEQKELVKKYKQSIENLAKQRVIEEKKIVYLEKRKQEALEPLTELEQHLDKKESELIDETERISEIKNNLKVTHKILDRKWNEFQKSTNRLIKREEGVATAEKKLSNAIQSLDKEQKSWRKHRDKEMDMMSQLNISITRRDNDVSQRENALEIIKKSLEERDDKVTQDERRIKDGYETLARSQKRLHGKR